MLIKTNHHSALVTHPNRTVFSRYKAIGSALIISSLLSVTAFAQVYTPIAGELGYRTASSGIATCSPPMIPDISVTGGADLNLTDDGTANVVMPFLFDFYGVRSDKLRIGNNGGMIFDATEGNLFAPNKDFGDTGQTGTSRILPFWDDLDTEQGGVYYQTVGTAPDRVFVIQWKDRPHYSGSTHPNPATIQAQLYESSNIIAFFYPDIDFGDGTIDNGISASVGLISDTDMYTKTSFNSDLKVILPQAAGSGIYYECYEPSYIQLETWLTQDYPPGDFFALSDVCTDINNPKLKTLTLDAGSNRFGMCFEVSNVTDQTLSRHTLNVTHSTAVLNNFPFDLLPNATVSIADEIEVNESGDVTVEYIASWSMNNPPPAAADIYTGTDTTTVKYVSDFLLTLIPAIIGNAKK